MNIISQWYLVIMLFAFNILYLGSSLWYLSTHKYLLYKIMVYSSFHFLFLFVQALLVLKVPLFSVFNFIMKSSPNLKDPSTYILKLCVPFSLRIVPMSFSYVSESFSHLTIMFRIYDLSVTVCKIWDHCINRWKVRGKFICINGGGIRGKVLTITLFNGRRYFSGEKLWIHNHTHILHNIHRFHLAPRKKRERICIILESTSIVCCKLKMKWTTLVYISSLRLCSGC